MRCASAAGRDLLHVVGRHEVATHDRRVRLRGAQQPEAGARRRAEHDARMVARRVGNVEHVVANGVRAVHAAHRGDRRRELGRDGHRRERVERVDSALAVEDLALGDAAGQPERAHEREPVELALGQRERAGAAERILRRDDEERVGELVRGAVDGDLALLHRLEQRGLGAGRGAVHLVDQQDVREDRAGPEIPDPARGPVHRGAGDVGRAGGRACTARGRSGRRSRRPSTWPAASCRCRACPRPGGARPTAARPAPAGRCRGRPGPHSPTASKSSDGHRAGIAHRRPNRAVGEAACRLQARGPDRPVPNRIEPATGSAGRRRPASAPSSSVIQAYSACNS